MNKSFQTASFYTRDHEWISFQDTQAYTGICSFKLLAIKKFMKYYLASRLALKSEEK